MKQKFLFASIGIASMLFFPGCKKDHAPNCEGNNKSFIVTTKVIATGLNNPRGLKFGPDQNLYVAEGGIGGTNISTQCQPVASLPLGPGPYMGNDSNSRISRIDWQGTRTTFVNYLPSTVTSAAAGSGVTGMADVAFVGNTLYGLSSGGGCSHGVPDVHNGIIKSTGNGTWKLIADYSQFLLSHPPANLSTDYTADGNPWSMVKVNNDLYVAEPNQQVIDRISYTTGEIHRVIDLSKTYPSLTHWIGPMSITYHNGCLYFGTLTSFPLVQGAATVYKLTLDGQLSVFATGFTCIMGITFDDNNNLYVLENTVGQPGPTPGFGDLVLVDPSGKRQVITSGLHLPTAMTFGPDGNLYISDWGIGPPGLGQIIQLSFKCQFVQADTKN
jgi:hypothetical protein